MVNKTKTADLVPTDLRFLYSLLFESNAVASDNGANAKDNAQDDPFHSTFSFETEFSVLIIPFFYAIVKLARLIFPDRISHFSKE